LHQVAISITSPDTESAIEDMRRAAGSCDLLELRLDRIRDADLPRLLSSAPKPVIATCRRAHEGGAFSGTDAERLSLLSQAGRRGAKYVDIELDSAEGFDPGPAKLILSYHDFTHVPDDIAAIHERICSLRPAAAKLVCTAKGAEDNMKMLLLNRGAPVPTAAFCMGKLGLPSRVLGRRYGARLTYAALDEASAAAPGQPTVALLTGTYRLRLVRSRTAVYGILGNPALHSVGPIFHNGAFEALGKDAVYVPFETANPGVFWSAFSGDIRGLSVTTPYKRKAVEFTKRLSPEAAKTGAVNTLVRSRGGFAGHNTDVIGVRLPLLRKLGTLAGKTVLILGAGGAAAAALYAVAREGARAFICNRTESKGETLASRILAQVVPWEQRGQVSCDVVINATAVGLRGEEEPLMPAGFFSPAMTAFDLVYHRGGTSFLRTAGEAGAVTIDGVEMFVAQALEQLRLWLGETPGEETILQLEARVRAALSA
jgi:3-dehydroquinate dehydratase/shikimate dehydrogenase